MGTLFVVATPIGNIKDITFRAVETLKKVNIIACEDTRVTKKLLSYYGIKGKKLIPYHEHNEEEVAELIINILKEEDVALVSDAGTPCISDPGYRVVKLAVEKGFRVSPVPGAFAGVAALSASGLPTDHFLFAGFLSHKKEKKRKEILRYAEIGYTFIIYESPYRLMETLKIFKDEIPESQVVVAKEITKLHERFIYGSPEDVYLFFKENPDTVRGEFVILCHPVLKKEVREEEIVSFIKSEKAKGKSNRDIAKEVTQKFGLPKKEAYRMVLEID